MGFIMNFLSLNDMFLISLQGNPIFGVNLNGINTNFKYNMALSKSQKEWGEKFLFCRTSFQLSKILFSDWKSTINKTNSSR